MRVEVTRKHIRKGKQFSSRQCPVTLAIMAAAPACDEIRVTRDEIWIDGVRHKQPQAVGNFVRMFDNLGGGSVMPFGFELDLRKSVDGRRDGSPKGSAGRNQTIGTSAQRTGGQ